MPDSEVAVRYLRDSFEPTDRLAVVLLRRPTQGVMQRLGTCEELARPASQRWLSDHNERGYEIYVSMNTLNADATGRTKKDIAAIRHLYLDFDDGGTDAVSALLDREDLPTPNYLVSTSPGKWQVIWKVQGFAKEDAENRQRGIARETGADPAATDIARVLRLPGFYNHKYEQPYLVRAQTIARDVYQPEQFPSAAVKDRLPSAWNSPSRVAGRKQSGLLSQSERDWAFAKRALARGESPAAIAAAIAVYRRYDKHNPHYYAELTVWKAAQALYADRTQELRRT